MNDLTPNIIEKSLKGSEYKAPEIRVKPEDLPRRPPNLCIGCLHRTLSYDHSKLDAFVFGDIGCYTLSAAPPFSTIPTSVCLGAWVSQAHGATKALGKICSVPNGSTFLHTGLTPFMDIVCNKGNVTTIIVDNRITGMTGHPEHPGTGFTIRGEPTNLLDYEEIGKALGVKSIRKINPFRINETMQVLKEEMDKDEQLSLVLCVDSPCVLLRREKRQFEHSLYEIDADKCRGIKVCLSISCLAVSWCEHGGKTIDGHKRKGIVYINPDQCVGGQGAILSSNIFLEAFLNPGYDVKKAEVHVWPDEVEM